MVYGDSLYENITEPTFFVYKNLLKTIKFWCIGCYIMMNNKERLIKSKLRVQKHGEVFTPSWIVEKMLNIDGIKECCENLSATFLEPSAGEGVFLVAILKRKLDMVAKNYCTDINQYENFSLYALSTLYGVELLEDNIEMCVMNLYQKYYEYYLEIAKKLNSGFKEEVLNSAKCIIKSNIRQGDFLTQLTNSNTSIIFSEWKSLKSITKKTKDIIISRKEYKLQDIYKNNSNQSINVQLSLFADSDEQPDINSTKYNYINVKIVDVYKEELEVYE